MCSKKVQKHPRSVISAFVICCLDSISSFYVQNFKPLVSVAEQTDLSLTGSQTPKTGFLVTRLICRSVIFALYLDYLMGMS